MVNPTPTQPPSSSPTPQGEASQSSVSPLRCFSGASISGAIATALYFLTSSIAQTFASKAIPSGNQFAVKISIAVRTLVVGLSTMATAIFAIATLGLIALGIKLLIQQFGQPQEK